MAGIYHNATWRYSIRCAFIRNGRNSSRPQPFSQTEKELLLKACDYTFYGKTVALVENPNAFRDKAFTLAQVETGWTIPRLCDLTLMDIDLENVNVSGVSLSRSAFSILKAYLEEWIAHNMYKPMDRPFLVHGNRLLSIFEYTALFSRLEYLTGVSLAYSRLHGKN